MAYLDKDSVIKVMDDMCKRCDHDECYRKSGREYCPVMEVIDGIKDLSAADVQQVVHCKDCKYAQNPNDTMVYCTYFECGTMSQNDFCSQGEDSDTNE